MNENTKQLIQKTRGARTALYPVLNKNSVIPMANRVSMYKIYIKPIISYATPAWTPLFKPGKWKDIKDV